MWWCFVCWKAFIIYYNYISIIIVSWEWQQLRRIVSILCHYMMSRLTSNPNPNELSLFTDKITITCACAINQNSGLGGPHNTTLKMSSKKVGELLNSAFPFDRETGVLVWQQTSISAFQMCPAVAQKISWLRNCFGNPCFTSCTFCILRGAIPRYMHTCKKREIPEIYLRKLFWIFRKILGWEREINTAPKPSPEVAPSKMEVAPS